MGFHSSPLEILLVFIDFFSAQRPVLERKKNTSRLIEWRKRV